MNRGSVTGAGHAARGLRPAALAQDTGFPDGPTGGRVAVTMPGSTS